MQQTSWGMYCTYSEFKQVKIQNRWNSAKQKSYAFGVWVMDTSGSFAMVQERVLLITVKKSTTDCYIIHNRGMGLKRKEELPSVSRKDREDNSADEGEWKDQKGKLDDT